MRRFLRADADTSTLILTPNRQWVGRVRAELYQGMGLLPRVYSADDWFSAFWNRTANRNIAPCCNSALLSTQQELAVWRQVLGREQAYLSALSTSLAGTCRDAYNKLLLYRMDPEAVRDYAPGAQLLHWAEAVDKDCERMGLRSHASAMAALAADMPPAVAELLPERVVLYGYAVSAEAETGPEPTPVLRALFQHLPPEHFSILIAAVEALPSATVHEAGTFEDELRTALRWAADSEGQVQIVVPNLPRQSADVERICHEILGTCETEYRLGRGQNLAESALGQQIIGWFSLAEGQQSFERICQLLRSSLLFPNPATDDQQVLLHQQRGISEVRYSLEQEVCRRAAMDAVGLRSLVAELREQAGAQQGLETTLLAHWQRGLTRLTRMPEQALLGDWGRLFYEQLGHLGLWQSSAIIDTQLAACIDWFEGLEVIEAVLPPAPVPLALALDWLSWSAESYTPAPVHSGGGRIRISGQLDPINSETARCWIIGFTASSWPVSPQPNPLLPPGLQRHLGVPGAREQDGLDFSRHLLVRLAGEAGHLHLSYSPAQPDELPQSSPLLAHMHQSVFEPVVAATPKRLVLETLQDSQGPPLLPDEQLATDVIQALLLQLQNPCEAFLCARLGAAEPRLPEVLPGAMQLGVLAHSAMAELLPRGSTSQTLAAIDATTVETCLRARARSYPYPQTLMEPLIANVQARILTWLAHEQALMRDFTVQSAEQILVGEIGGLSVRCRVDRIDEVAGGRVLIDYKTGARQPVDWQGDWRERAPVSLQMPVYAALYQLLEAPVRGLLLAQLVGPQEAVLRGWLASEVAEEFADGIDTWTVESISDHLLSMEPQLEELASELRSGHASDTVGEPGDVSLRLLFPLPGEQCAG